MPAETIKKLLPQGTTNDFFNYLRDLMTQHSHLFQDLGENLFHSFAVILLVWFGLKTAFAVSSGIGAFPLDKLADLLMTIAIGYALITYYANPVPGVGRSFHQIITDQGLALANQLNHESLSRTWEQLNDAYLGQQYTPSVLKYVANPMPALRFLAIYLAIALAEGTAFLVISYGYFATAVCVLVGPLFIPFFIVPSLDWIFWGWIRSFLQYVFYQVIANAYLFVFGGLLVGFFQKHPPPYDGANMAVLFLPMLSLLVSFTIGLLLIPSLVNSIFTGRSGETTGVGFR